MPGPIEVNIWTILATLLVIFAGSRVQKLFRGQRAVGYLPGLTIPFQPIGFPGGVIKTLWWNPGLEFMWKWRSTFYSQRGTETISLVPFIFGDPAIITSNIDVAKQFAAGPSKSGFGKMNPEKLGPLSFWGMSLLISDGDMWKRHRRIVGPSFSNNLYKLVWSEAIRTYSEMVVEEGFEDKKVVELPVVQSLTTKFTLLIIGRCGFGFPFTWAEPIPAAGDKMSFPQAVRTFMRRLQLLHLATWAQSIPLPPMNELNACIAVLRSFMEHNIHQKEDEIRSNRGQQNGNDIFTVLVQANDAETDQKLKLDHSELISNVFLMLIAGHETTALTLAATIACLAKHQEYQQEIFEQIQSVVGNAREPTFEDYAKLDKVQASVYETLRLFPIAYMAVREAHQDTILHIPDSNEEGRTTTIHVAKGTQVLIDHIGINYNPRYFDDPEEFKPSRWNGVTNESEPYSFGIGPRACIGRKFAMSEAVCILTMFLRDWKFEPLLQDNETVDAWYDKLSRNAQSVVTLAIANVPLRLVRRV
ncbi:cytochrome P450 [Cyathus striatus]|nr:cytochrome P450 [Cyathus striatus]